MVIGLVTRSKFSLRNLCEPVQRKARWEMHTWEAMVTWARLRIRTSSPIHTWSPIESRHGNVMFTLERITTPLPTLAPKTRSAVTFRNDGTGNQGAKSNERTIHQSPSLNLEAPRLKSALLNRSSLMRSHGERSRLCFYSASSAGSIRKQRGRSRAM